MNIDKKLDILSKIAEKLNEEKIVWAIGASLLLYIKGKTTEFNDIDIMVAEEDVEKLNKVLLTMGDLQQPNPNNLYKTKYFMEYLIDGIDVDIMAGFTIVKDNKEYYFPLKYNDIKEYTFVKGHKIPYNL